MEIQTFFKKCSICKKEIAFAAKYWVCSVSTCTRQRTGLMFCSVTCCDAHIPMMNHRDSGAIEKRAPTQQQFIKEQQIAPPPKDEASTPKSGGMVRAPTQAAKSFSSEGEILVVVSKLKDYIRSTSGMNTSDSVALLLSTKIRSWLDNAIRRAVQEQRTTVLDRDIR